MVFKGNDLSSRISGGKGVITTETTENILLMVQWFHNKIQIHYHGNTSRVTFGMKVRVF